MDEDRATGAETDAEEAGGEQKPDGADEESSEHTEPGKLPRHVAAALCYVLSFASGVVFLVLEPDDRSIRFHAFQSILLGVVVLILEFGIWVLGWIPPLGFLLGEVLRWLVGFASIVITIILMAKAFGGEDYQLPYIGPRAAKLARPYD